MSPPFVALPIHPVPPLAVCAAAFAVAAPAAAQSLSCDPAALDTVCRFQTPALVELVPPAAGASVTATGYDTGCITVTPNPAVATGASPGAVRFRITCSATTCPCSTTVTLGSTGYAGCTLTVQCDRQSAASPYGQGCLGSNGSVPAISATGVPAMGNGFFAIDLAGARPGTTAVVYVATQPSATPLGPCTLLFEGPSITLPPVNTNAAGAAITPFGIPNNPSLFGAVVYSQYLVLDAGGALYGVGALSAGLRLVVAF